MTATLPPERTRESMAAQALSQPGMTESASVLSGVEPLAGRQRAERLESLRRQL